MFIVHAPASPFGGSRFICRQAAPYALLVSHLRQKCYGVTSGNQPFVNLRSEHLFLRYAYRSGTIFSSAVGSVKQHQQTYRYGACKTPIYAVYVSTDRKSTKSIAFISQYHHHTGSPARCIFIPENPFFGHSSI